MSIRTGRWHSFVVLPVLAGHIPHEIYKTLTYNLYLNTITHQSFQVVRSIPQFSYYWALTMIFNFWFSIGPLIRSWCMRFEAKHHEFKRLAANLGNFTNLAYTLARRHQEGICYRLQTSEGNLSSFIKKGIETGPGNIY